METKAISSTEQYNLNDLSIESLAFNQSILARIDLITSKLGTFGFKVKTTSPNSLQRLDSMSIEAKKSRSDEL